MARVFVITYKNSGFATFVSIVGSILLFSGLGITFCVIWYTGLIMTALGAALMFGASHISKRRGFKKWIKRLQADGIIDALPNSEELCIKLYQANPCKRTLTFIRKRNPQAADYISKFIAIPK